MSTIISSTTVIRGHMGTDVVTANGIANISKNLIICFCLGIFSRAEIRSLGCFVKR